VSFLVIASDNYFLLPAGVLHSWKTPVIMTLLENSWNASGVNVVLCIYVDCQ